MKKRWIVLLLCLVLCLSLLPGGIRWATKRFYPLGYQELVEKYAAENGLEPAFIYAVIKTESGFRPNATSNVNARGLMQIIPDAFTWLAGLQKDNVSTFEDMYDPETNIRYGCYLLGMLYREFGSYRLAAAGYHAGPGSVRKWLQDPDCSPDGKTVEKIPSSATGHYVYKVMGNYEKYCELYNFK